MRAAISLIGRQLKHAPSALDGKLVGGKPPHDRFQDLMRPFFEQAKQTFTKLED
jgi:hypothetical protein